MARLATAINQYQTNNNGKVPSAGAIAPVTGEGGGDPEAMPSCGTNCNDATRLVVTYLNSVNADSNEFMDPDGAAYGITIQALSNGDEMSPASFDHIAYVYTNAECSGEKAVYSSNRRDYAIVYRMEGSGVYCKDSR